MKNIVEVNNISKKYKIGEQSNVYATLRDVLSGNIKRDKSASWFNALEDVSFNICEGENIGIIGRNGAGKSTLLKIISRITPPHKGTVRLYGRVASLLEVGTGFHSELTGRENVFFNGAILGLTKKEITLRFDEIVSFSGVEKYIDTPLKHYSSGMQLRLAFAVAAHLNPEILVVDEVLAVGDAEFQKKSIGKIGEVSRSGRTVIFVSHNMGIISQLCEKTLVLDSGKIHCFTKTPNAIQEYMTLNATSSKEFQTREINKNIPAQVLNFRTIDCNGNQICDFMFTDNIIIQSDIIIHESKKELTIAFSIHNNYKAKILTILKQIDHLKPGKYTLKIELQNSIIVPGVYSINSNIYVPDLALFETITDYCEFSIIDSGTDFSRYKQGEYGCVIINSKWEIEAF